jgi:hypothetical protein
MTMSRCGVAGVQKSQHLFATVCLCYSRKLAAILRHFEPSTAATVSLLNPAFRAMLSKPTATQSATSRHQAMSAPAVIVRSILSIRAS